MAINEAIIPMDEFIQFMQMDLGVCSIGFSVVENGFETLLVPEIGLMKTMLPLVGGKRFSELNKGERN